MSGYLKITVRDKAELADFITNAIIHPMKRKLTGSIEIHILEGEIKAYEIKVRSRHINDLKKHWGTEDPNDE